MIILYFKFGSKTTFTVPFRSIQQSHVTGPPKWPKCHGSHGQFPQVPKSSSKLVLNTEKFPCLLRKTAENLSMSRQLWESAKTKITADPSCITGPAKLNEMVEYFVLIPPLCM